MKHAELFEAGTIIMALMLWYSAFGKIKGFSGTAKMMSEHGFPFPQLALAGGFAWEVLGGLGLVIERSRAIAAAALCVYVLIATLMVHGKDWLEHRRHGDAIQVVKNLMVIAGLLCMAAV